MGVKIGQDRDAERTVDVAGGRDAGNERCGSSGSVLVYLFFKVGMDDDDIRGKIRLRLLLRKPLLLTVGGRASSIEQRDFLFKTGQALSY